MSALEVWPLTPAHINNLRTFECARGHRQPWVPLVEELIRDRLPDEMANGTVHGLGLWQGATLVAVTAWSPAANDETVWRCHVVAVRMGHGRRGYGLRMKTEVVNRAVRAGVRAIVSDVHWDNAGMIAINERFGGAASRLDRDYVRFTIRVTPGVP